MHSFLSLITVLVLSTTPFVEAAEPFLKPHDVIALVGGEDMVAMSEYGYLELLLVRALPEHKLRFRNLAWEGDTVFEQPRELNFPTLEQQLDKVGATVVIAQFGQMESLAGKEKLPEFIAAYEKLFERMSGGAKRKIALVGPNRFASSLPQPGRKIDDVMQYSSAVFAIVDRRRPQMRYFAALDSGTADVKRDGVHWNSRGQAFMACRLAPGIADVEVHAARQNGKTVLVNESLNRNFETWVQDESNPLLAAIRAKNRLWFQYWRPQNWAFLAGDRTTQPSSRDHVDPSKRWFPAEIEAFLPLIEAKEREIDALAAKLAKP